jgi:hypothetical protein
VHVPPVIELADDVEATAKQLALESRAVGGAAHSLPEKTLETIQRFS